MTLLHLSGVRVAGTGRDRLRVRELGVQEGELLAVLGPTGAGKSTLLQVMHFLLRADSGALCWRGKEVGFPAPLALRRRIAMAFQDPHLFTGTVAANAAYGLHVRGVRGSQARGDVTSILETLRIGPLAERQASTLSGGEAQRLALARTLVVQPELLLLDEPLASLDEPVREALLGELVQIIRRRGITCVLVTHDQAEALAVADRIAVLDRGELVQLGSPEDVYYRPRSRFVAEFVRTGNIVPGVVVEGADGVVRVSVEGGEIEAVSDLPRGSRVMVCVRPEEVLVGPAGQSAPSSARNRMTGRVSSVVRDGPVVRVTVACGCVLTALVTRPSAADLGLGEGVAVSLTFKATAVHLLPESEA